MEYKIKKDARDTIINYLSSLTVPARDGANLMEIVKALSSLEEIKIEIKKEETTV